LASNHDEVDNDEENIAMETFKDVELVIQPTVAKILVSEASLIKASGHT
jgi:hypothetical protein